MKVDKKENTVNLSAGRVNVRDLCPHVQGETCCVCLPDSVVSTDS